MRSTFYCKVQFILHFLRSTRTSPYQRGQRSRSRSLTHVAGAAFMPQ